MIASTGCRLFRYTRESNTELYVHLFINLYNNIETKGFRALDCQGGGARAQQKGKAEGGEELARVFVRGAPWGFAQGLARVLARVLVSCSIGLT